MKAAEKVISTKNYASSPVAYLGQRLLAFIKKDFLAWLLILPSILVFSVFVWGPLISGIILSFCETRGFEVVRFIGFQNYIDIMNDSLFIQAMTNSFMYVLWSLIIGMFLPILTAITLNETSFLKGFFRLSIYFPNMVPGITAAIMWATMFEPSSGGLLNLIIGWFGIAPQQWLQNAQMTIPLIIVSITWGAFGSTSILYLADLQSVSVDLYEAASLDGAGIFRKAWHVTLPHMSSLLKVFFIMQVMAVFKLYAEPLAMTGGGPNNASISITMLAQRYAFNYFQIGKSVSVSVLASLVLMICTVVYFKMSKERANE